MPVYCAVVISKRVSPTVVYSISVSFITSNGLLCIAIDSKASLIAIFRACGSEERCSSRMAAGCSSRMAAAQSFCGKFFIIFYVAFFHLRSSEFFTCSSLYVPRCRDPDLGGQELLSDQVSN